MLDIFRQQKNSSIPKFSDFFVFGMEITTLNPTNSRAYTS